MIRVLLVDDDDLVRAGLAMILDAADDIKVVGEAATGAEAIRIARESRPDVVLMDVKMPGMDGIEATRTIRSLGDDPPRVVIVTTFETDEFLFRSLQAGASGFVLKRTPPHDLVAGIRAVASGDGLLGPSVTRRIIEEFADRPVPSTGHRRHLELLTEREMETLKLLAQGMNNTEIADAMYVSESTAKTHVRRTLMKLGLRDRVAAVIFAYQAGLMRSEVERSD
jgi:DNA-binding NarL/FixJ family response regulator